MELHYNFLPQDFNDKNKEFVERSLDSYTEKLENELRRPDSPLKESRLKTIRHYIDMYHWYLDVYDSVMAEKNSGNVRYFPTSYRGDEQ